MLCTKIEGFKLPFLTYSHSCRCSWFRDWWRQAQQTSIAGWCHLAYLFFIVIDVTIFLLLQYNKHCNLPRQKASQYLTRYCWRR